MIKHLGFSFHSTADELDAILTQHPEMEFVQLQINYADWDSPDIQSRACYETARKHGKPVIIMEPVKGGNLANPPDPVKAVFDEADPEASYASWALRFAADLEGLITVLSGMSNVEQMQDNLQAMKGFTGLSDNERATLEKAREALASIPIIPCTTCDYCAKVCPQNIGISRTFNARNLITLYDNKEFAMQQIKFIVGLHHKNLATECIQCGACEDVCPQNIKIISELEKIVNELDLHNLLESMKGESMM